VQHAFYTREVMHHDGQCAYSFGGCCRQGEEGRLDVKRDDGGKRRRHHSVELEDGQLPEPPPPPRASGEPDAGRTRPDITVRSPRSQEARRYAVRAYRRWIVLHVLIAIAFGKEQPLVEFFAPSIQCTSLAQACPFQVQVCCLVHLLRSFLCYEACEENRTKMKQVVVTLPFWASATTQILRGPGEG
jgi:hypothetical protein